MINNLLEYRTENKTEIENISKWYRDNFFNPLSHENLINTFGFRNDN